MLTQKMRKLTATTTWTSAQFTARNTIGEFNIERQRRCSRSVRMAAIQMDSRKSKSWWYEAQSNIGLSVTNMLSGEQCSILSFISIENVFLSSQTCCRHRWNIRISAVAAYAHINNYVDIAGLSGDENWWRQRVRVQRHRLSRLCVGTGVPVLHIR